MIETFQVEGRKLSNKEVRQLATLDGKKKLIEQFWQAFFGNDYMPPNEASAAMPDSLETLKHVAGYNVSQVN